MFYFCSFSSTYSRRINFKAVCLAAGRRRTKIKEGHFAQYTTYYYCYYQYYYTALCDVLRFAGVDITRTQRRCSPSVRRIYRNRLTLWNISHETSGLHLWVHWWSVEVWLAKRREWGLRSRKIQWTYRTR